MKNTIRESIKELLKKGTKDTRLLERLAGTLASLETADYYAARTKAIEGDALSDARKQVRRRHGRLDDGPRPSLGPNPCGEIDLGPVTPCVDRDKQAQDDTNDGYGS